MKKLIRFDTLRRYCIYNSISCIRGDKEQFCHYIMEKQRNCKPKSCPVWNRLKETPESILKGSGHPDIKAGRDY